MRRYLGEDALDEAIVTSLKQAKDSGEFDGYTPVKGSDYWTSEERDAIIRDVVASGDFATNTTISELVSALEAGEPYLPLAGGTLTGNLYMTGNSAITIGDETSTSYGGIQSVRACADDEGFVNTAGYFINVDGSSKFLHRRGGYNIKEDAYLLMDGRGYRFFAGGDKGVIVSAEGSSGEGATPLFTMIANDVRPTFKGKELALQEDVEKIKAALVTLGVSIE